MNERIDTKVSASVFITDKANRLLLINIDRNGDLKWSPPGGGMVAHENPLTTAIREAKEETGFDVELKNLIGIYTVDRGEITGIGFVFRDKIIGGSARLEVSDDKVMEYKYFTDSEIDDLINNALIFRPNEYNLQAIKDWRDGKSFSLGV